MRWAPIEVNFAGALVKLQSEGGVLSTSLNEDALVRLLVEEGRGYHAVEIEILQRRVAEAQWTEQVDGKQAGVDLSRALDHHVATREALTAEAARVLVQSWRCVDEKAAKALMGDHSAGVVVEFLEGSYGLNRDLNTRRELLRLPEGHDWR